MAYRLHIIMRTDMASMNPGKAMAHAAHAANDFDGMIFEFLKKSDNKGTILADGYREWVEDRYFGTTLAFGGKEADIYRVCNRSYFDGMSGLVIDPSYPIRDGEITHHINIMTCGWVFCNEYDWKANPDAAALSLHP